MYVMGLEKTVDRASYLSLKVVHYNESRLISYTSSLRLYVGNNNLFDVLNPCLCCGPVLPVSEGRMTP